MAFTPIFSYILERASARETAARVAAARKLPLEKVRRLVAEHLIPGDILGENVINVMTLNAALDTLPPS